MATREKTKNVSRERPYYGYAPVGDLQRYLLYKKQQILTAMEKKEIPSRNLEKAVCFQRLLTNILDSEYFHSQMLDSTVKELKDCLSEDYALDRYNLQTAKERLKKLSAELETAEKEMSRFEELESGMVTEYDIPDEQRNHYMATKVSYQEHKFEVDEAQDNVAVCEGHMKLIHNLLGIIARPNGFFGCLYI